MDVRICAHGTLSEGALSELVGFEERFDGAGVELRGTVVDQPDLIGLLGRLRRCGLAIRDVEVVPGPGTPADQKPPARLTPAVARFEFRGHVASLLRLVLEDAQLSEDAARTTLEVPLPNDGDSFFEVLARLEHLALEIREVHVHGVPKWDGERVG